MKKTRTRVAAERMVRNVADRTDKFLAKAGESARKRLRIRNRSKLRTAGKVALVLGVGAATAYAGRTIAHRAGNRRSGSARKK